MSASFKSLCLQAAAIALACGLVEGIEIAAFRPMLLVQPMAKVSVDILWVAPLVHLIIEGALALALGALVILRVPLPAVVPPALFAFAGALGISMYSGLLGLGASLMLAAGVAVQTARVLANRVSTAQLWRAIWLLTSIFVATWTGLRVADAVAARSVSATTPPIGSPNVLIVVLDTVRADRLSPYGYGVPTPTLERLAREGTLFEMALASSSWTLPTHASLLTGLSQAQHGAASVSTVLGPNHPQLQQRFSSRGYRTGAFVANNIFVIPERGFAGGFQVFDVHYLRALVARTTWGRVFQKALLRVLHVELDPLRSAPTIGGAFARWQAAGSGRPFFALLNFMDAHEPYHPGTRPPSLGTWQLRNRRTSADNAQLSRDYDDAIRAIDAELARLETRGRQAGWWDNTILVVLADHGEAMARGEFDHGNNLTLEQIRVPLIFRYPAHVQAGVRVAYPVSVVDVAPTIEALAQPGSGATPRSLLRSPTPTSTDEPVVAELIDPNQTQSQHLVTVVFDGYQYIRNIEDSTEHLYSLQDIAGEHDLAAKPELADQLGRMRQALHDAGSPR